MRLRLAALTLALVTRLAVAATDAECRFDPVPVGRGKIGAWVDQSNWLNVDHQRVTLQTAEVFMKTKRWRPPAESLPLQPAARTLDTARVKANDPLDGTRRDLSFLLDSRLYADGLLVLHRGKVVVERYRNGLSPSEPRLLLHATRPLLALLGAIALGQGTLIADRSVTRYLAMLSNDAALRRFSVQRLLQGRERYSWGAEELLQWRQAAGWSGAEGATGVRTWLSQAERWDRPVVEWLAPSFVSAPEDDLLAWMLAESQGGSLATVFCKQILSRSKPEHEVLWLTDTVGNELADGLALSLRDFTRLGQSMVEARFSRGRGPIPAWFLETLTASSGIRNPALAGLPRGSELRYSYVHLGGRAGRVAIIGGHGSSLYLDFDHRTVIALFATHPQAGSPALLATLNQLWTALDQAVHAQ